MKVVYFDRNVFAHICDLNCGINESDVAKIQRAVDSGAIIIPASYTVIEETVPLIHSSEEKYERHIQTVLNLIDKDRIIKPHQHLLRDDCLSYAYGESKTERTTGIPSNLREVLDLSINQDGLHALAEEIHAFYANIVANQQRDFDRLIEETKRRGFNGLHTFQELWEMASLTIIERAVNRLPRIPMRLCKKRGLKAMLNIRSVRIYTLYYCWLAYSHWLKTDGTPGKMKASEAGDFYHAVCASAADIFVTQEHKDRPGSLPFILSLIPMSGFTVMSLREFLETL